MVRSSQSLDVVLYKKPESIFKEIWHYFLPILPITVNYKQQFVHVYYTAYAFEDLKNILKLQKKGVDLKDSLKLTILV